MDDSVPKMGDEAIADAHPGWEVGPVVEQVWNDLQGTVSRSTIHETVVAIITEYEDARIKTYVPIFVRRRTADRLRAGLSGTTPDSPA